MKRLYEQLLGELEQGRAAVMAVIIARTGSAPRGAGARMLVKSDGAILGTIGGGAVEYQAVQTALESLRTGRSFIRAYTLSHGEAADIGMVCGGDVEVYFQYVTPEDMAFCTLCRKILELLEEDEDSWLILDITDPVCWQMGCCSPAMETRMADEEKDKTAGGLQIPPELICRLSSGKASQHEIAGRRYYTEPLVQAGRVLVFGGGHVAQELVPVLHHIGFRCVVMDDREAFASPLVFPQAERTIVGDLRHIADHITIRPCDYVCIMTRGHEYDYYVQRQALDAKPRYIGVMGSRSKIRAVTEKLLEDGYTPSEIQSCHMPIGTAIYASTPAEIAVSIAGELIAERAKGRQ